MTTPDQNLGACAICGDSPQFTDSAPGANPVSYCSCCLPVHMQTAAAAGQMPLQGAVTVPQLQEAARELDIDGRSSMKKEELSAAVNEAVADALPEPVVEDPVEMSDAPTSDESLPKPKKASKKR